MKRQGDGPPLARPPLSDPELEVLRLVATGISDKAIGYRLGISHWTVKSRLARVFDELKAKNRGHAIALAYERGFLTPAVTSQERL